MLRAAFFAAKETATDRDRPDRSPAIKTLHRRKSGLSPVWPVLPTPHQRPVLVSGLSRLATLSLLLDCLSFQSMNASRAAVAKPITMIGVFPPISAWVPSSRSTTILKTKKLSIIGRDRLMFSIKRSTTFSFAHRLRLVAGRQPYGRRNHLR